MSLYVAVRQWLQPYYRPKPANAVSKGKSAAETERAEADRSVNGDPDLKCKVLNTATPLTQAIRAKKKPVGNTIYCYRDDKLFQVFAHFERGQGYKYPQRNDAKRKQLEPIIYPLDLPEPADRTHLIPIGFHGSENDNRLLINWDRNHNQNEMREFEKRAKALNKTHPVYWLTSINKVKGGLAWHYRVWDADDIAKPPLKLDLTLPCKYVWR